VQDEETIYKLIGDNIMTINVNVSEVQALFPELLARVQDGEEIVIAQNGSELARLVPGKDALKAVPKQQLQATHEQSKTIETTTISDQVTSEQTLDEALEGLIGTISLENAPADLSERTGYYFTEIVIEKHQRLQEKDA
jgi:prevent-host-death family protein